MKKLDRSKPYGTIFGTNDGRQFEQDGEIFRGDGSVWSPGPEAGEPDPPSGDPVNKEPKEPKLKPPPKDILS